MRKIPTIFERDWQGDKSRVLDRMTSGTEWVFPPSEGIATRKYDGTAVMIHGGGLYCRYDAKHGKTPPADFLPAQPEYDAETGHWPGWVPAGNNPQYKWQRACYREVLPDGTYEACGPHFQGNPEHFAEDILLLHGADVIDDVPYSYKDLADWFRGRDIEGIVWHHPDGRMAKIKKRDFGLGRKD
jgi:hypothetical protein